MARFFRTKPVEMLVHDSEQPGRRLRRALGPWNLVSLGIGAIVGAGIFSMVGTAAAGADGRAGAGPALVISFLLVAVACAFAGLCYAEFAAMVPVAGSAYTYAYATLGELVAWMIGWDLLLEYAVGNVAVAISWSAYFQELLRGFHFEWPVWLGTDYRSASQAVASIVAAKAGHTDLAALGAGVLRDAKAMEMAPHLFGIPIIFNLPAVLIVAILTWVLVLGIRESAWFNTAMVIVKLAIIAFFLGVGMFHINPANWTPFAPNGLEGISKAAASIFFAYIGFDAVSTAAEESRNPQRDLPIGILGSLVVCTIIYVGVAIVLTGLAPYKTLGNAEPLAAAFSNLGMQWAAGVVAVGALFATTSVLIAFQIGQPRIFLAMARDGLLPGWAAKVHPKFQTPHVTTILTGVLVAVFSGITNINEMADLTNIGTLFAFVVVALGIMVMRRTNPDRPRPFRTPWVPLVPIGGIVCCVYMMIELPPITWQRFVIWMFVGLIVYLGYGVSRSRVGAAKASSPPAA